MFIKQLSVFVENKSGRLADITAILSKANIDIRALSIADTTDFGILRLVVDKPSEAERILKDASLTVSLTTVIAVCIPDKPGGLSKALRVLAEKDIDVEYMYAFISRDTERAYLIMRVRDNNIAASVLTANGFELLSEDSVYRM